MSVVHNTPIPQSVLRKKRNSVCYHAVCESVAVGESLVEHKPSKENISDLEHLINILSEFDAGVNLLYVYSIFFSITPNFFNKTMWHPLKCQE